jgi:glycosyltransferase involved in cell wall biosynthesis
MEISVIVCNYNNSQFLSRCIRSAINQSFNKNEYEVVVVDDCSTDDSIGILTRFSDKITIIQNENNMGLAESCNKAVALAESKFCFFLDADDYIGKNVLSIQHDFVSHNKDYMDAVSCDYLEVDTRENVLRRRNGESYPIRCGTMYYTDHLLRLGPYDKSVPREDIDFRERFLKSGKYIYNVPIPYYRYTQHNSSITKNNVGEGMINEKTKY